MHRPGRQQGAGPEVITAAKDSRAFTRLAPSFVLAAGINLVLLYLVLRLVDPGPPVLEGPVRYPAVERARVIEVPPAVSRAPAAVPEATPAPPPLPDPDIPAEPALPSLQPPVNEPHFESRLLPLADVPGGPVPAEPARVSAPDATGIDTGSQIAPVYPPRARRAGIEGSVTVEFTITPSGSVEAPNVVESRPRGVFDAAVLRAVRQWTFPAATEGGAARERRVRKEIVFSLEDR